MPLTDLQRDALKVLQPFRNEHNYVAGGAALNQRWPRMSDDLDIFLDFRGQLPAQIEQEVRALRDAGFSVETTTSDSLVVEVILRKYGFETRIQWFDDVEERRRFFPAARDEELGFRLHDADLAVNKILAASRRKEVRDAVDVANIVRRYAPLGPLVWAAAGKDRAVSPLKMLQGIRDNAFGFSDEQVRTVRMAGDRVMRRTDVREVLSPAIEAAFQYCEETAPAQYAGCLFVDRDERPIEADDETLGSGAASALPLRDFGPTPAIVEKPRP